MVIEILPLALFIHVQNAIKMLLVSLTGKDCVRDRIPICVICSLSFLDKVRELIKKKYGIEFTKQSSKRIYDTIFFDNITDNRDITFEIEIIGDEDYVVAALTDLA